MTFVYNFVFVVVWGAVALAVPGAIVCAVWAVLDERSGVWVGVPLGVTCLVFTGNFCQNLKPWRARASTKP